MTSTPVAALIVVLTLAAVLLVSGAEKLRDVPGTQVAFDSLRVPTWVPRRSGAIALPVAELVLAFGLVLARGSWLVAFTVLTLLLMLAYTALIARALGFREQTNCGCFGRLGDPRVGRRTLVRNVMLSALAAWGLLLAIRGESLWGALRAAELADWSALAAAAILSALVFLISSGSAAPTSVVRDEAQTSPGEFDYLRTAIPHGFIETTDGERVHLRELAAQQARLIVWLNTSCEPCLRVAAHVDGWSEQLAPAVDLLAVYSTTPAPDAMLHHDRSRMAHDPDDNVRTVFGLPGSPAAVLLGADGMLAGGPVLGETDVLDLVADVLDQLRTDAPDAAGS